MSGPRLSISQLMGLTAIVALNLAALPMLPGMLFEDPSSLFLIVSLVRVSHFWHQLDSDAWILLFASSIASHRHYATDPSVI